MVADNFSFFIIIQHNEFFVLGFTFNTCYFSIFEYRIPNTTSNCYFLWLLYRYIQCFAFGTQKPACAIPFNAYIYNPCTFRTVNGKS